MRYFVEATLEHMRLLPEGAKAEKEQSRSEEVGQRQRGNGVVRCFISCWVPGSFLIFFFGLMMSHNEYNQFFFRDVVTAETSSERSDTESVDRVAGKSGCERAGCRSLYLCQMTSACRYTPAACLHFKTVDVSHALCLISWVAYKHPLLTHHLLSCAAKPAGLPGAGGVAHFPACRGTARPSHREIS